MPGWPPKSISTAGIVAPAATAVRTPASLRNPSDSSRAPGRARGCSLLGRVMKKLSTPKTSVRCLSIADFLNEGAPRPEEVGDLHPPARAGRELADVVHAPRVIADSRWPLKP